MPGAPASQGKNGDSKAAGGLGCPGSAGITRGPGSSGSSLHSFPSQLFIGVTAENKSCAVSTGILITFYELSWFSIPMCNLLLNPAADAVSVRCLLPPMAAGSPLPLVGLGTAGTFREAVLVPWLCQCWPGSTTAPCHWRAGAGWFWCGHQEGLQGLSRDYSPPELHGKSSTKIDFYVNLFCPKH